MVGYVVCDLSNGVGRIPKVEKSTSPSTTDSTESDVAIRKSSPFEAERRHLQVHRRRMCPPPKRLREESLQKLILRNYPSPSPLRFLRSLPWVNFPPSLHDLTMALVPKRLNLRAAASRLQLRLQIKSISGRQVTSQYHTNAPAAL